VTKPLNRYSPHYDHDEECVTMGLDDNGDWVHVVRVRAVLKERDEARAQALADLHSLQNAHEALADAVEAQSAALRERDEARAEVERLREKIKAFAWEAQDLRAKNANLLADWRANQRREVAERQREACAVQFDTGPERKRVWASVVRATPLVTEENKP